jgi:hypothetical protein
MPRNKVDEEDSWLLYEAVPDFRQAAGEIKVEGEGQDLTFSDNGSVFQLVLQNKA